MQKATPRGILSADRQVLSPRQRQEYLRLKANGVADSVARQLAFAFDKRRREDALAKCILSDLADTQPIAKRAAQPDIDLAVAAMCHGTHISLSNKAATHYERRFVAGAKEALAPDQFAAVHARARGQAGGHASATARARAKAPEGELADLWQRRNALTAELNDLDRQIAALPMQKDAAVGTTHVDVPLPAKAPKRKKKPKVAKQEGVSRMFAERNNSFAPLVSADDKPIDQRMVNAGRLVAGMDYEMRLGATDAEDARARASRNLQTNVAQYDRIFQPDPELRTVSGVDVDLGSGQARQAGYLGLDLYPYDYGTALHDVSLGLPFADSSVRSIRLVNALEFMPDFSGDATPLMLEIQRVLNYGGKFFYEGLGDLEDHADFSLLPGLVLVEHEDTRPVSASQDPTESLLHRQVYERVRVRVPQIYGADPEWLGTDEDTPLDVAFALEAMGVAAPADYVMADLIGKSEGVKPPKAVQSACQRGLELAPEYGGKGLTEGAKARARNMAAGQAVSLANLKRMKSFFARHTEEKEANPPSPGYVAWLLWGGDAGKRWATSQVDRLEKGKKPLGAAFSHARASGKKKDPKSVRRRANEYLRSQGHEPMEAKKAVAAQMAGAVPFVKAGQDKWEQVFYCVIYAPNERDTDGEYIEPSDIRKMAHQAMLDRVPIHLEHSGHEVDCHLVESWVVPEGYTVQGQKGPQHIRKGAWMGGFWCKDKVIWQAILDGELNGVSVGGTAAGEYR